MNLTWTRTHDHRVTSSYTNQYTMTNLQCGQLVFWWVKICYYMTFYWQITTISALCGLRATTAAMVTIVDHFDVKNCFNIQTQKRHQIWM